MPDAGGRASRSATRQYKLAPRTPAVPSRRASRWTSGIDAKSATGDQCRADAHHLARCMPELTLAEMRLGEHHPDPGHGAPSRAREASRGGIVVQPTHRKPQVASV